MTKLVSVISLMSILMIFAACVPQNEDHDAVDPAPVPQTSASSTSVMTAPPAPVSAPASSSSSSSSSTTATADKVIDVAMNDAGGNYVFEPGDLTFTTGETVQFNLSSENEFHSFVVDDLGIEVEVEGGETDTLTFTFDKPGVYTLICVPHETLGMVGTITVQ